MAALCAATGGCVVNDKGVEGVFKPAAIDTPPSIGGRSGNAEAKPKSVAESRRSSLSVPSR